MPKTQVTSKCKKITILIIVCLEEFSSSSFRGFWMFALSLTLFDDSYGLLRNHFLLSSSWSSSSSSVNHILWPIIHRFISPYTVCKIYNLCKNTLFVNFHILSLSSYAFVESQNERKRGIVLVLWGHHRSQVMTKVPLRELVAQWGTSHLPKC